MLDDPRAQLQNAYTLIKAGQKSQAFEMLKPLVKQQPDDAEGWWLVANTAPTPQIAAQACERVLALKPDYMPAVQMLSEHRLVESRNLLDQNKKLEARDLLQTVLDRQPDNAHAWLLMASAAPSQIDAVLTLQKFLAIEPENTMARQLLMDLQNRSAKDLGVKHKIKEAKPKERKTRWWAVFALLGIIGLVIGGGYFAINITGNNLGIPIGSLFNTRVNLGSLGDKTLAKTGTLIVGAKHDYTFYGRFNTHVLIMVAFPILKADPTPAITILGPDSKPLKLTQSTFMSMGGQYDITLPTTGYFTIRITGIADIAQGPYQLYVVAVPDDMNFSNFGNMTQP
jgi:hypothetical protein